MTGEFVYRNPNEPAEADGSHGGRQERSRFKNIEWTAYESIHKKYLSIGKSHIVQSISYGILCPRLGAE